MTMVGMTPAGGRATAPLPVCDQRRVMKPSRISSGSSFEAVAGYSRALVVEHDGWAEVHISGVTGFNYATMTIDEDQAVQTRQCFATIKKVLGEAGGDLGHIVRVRYLLTTPA